MGNKSVKERILERSLELFYTQGVHNTGINQIIKESRVAKASFYQHFSSKDDLILECLDHYNTLVLSQYQWIIETSQSFAEFQKKWLGTIKGEIENRTFNGCPVVNIRFGLRDFNEKYQQCFQSIIDSWTDILFSFLKKLQQEGKLPRAVDPLSLSRKIIVLYEGAVIMWKLTEKTDYLEDIGTIFDY